MEKMTEGGEIVFVDTGEETLKGGRIKRVEKYIQSDLFHLTYGDGVCDVDINGYIDIVDIVLLVDIILDN